MRISTLLVASAIAFANAPAQSLTPADREALMEKLEKLREDATSRVDARFRTAIAAYTAAAGSDQEAMDLYLNCVEKVDFEDQGKKSSDFREWKRKESDKLSSAARGYALRLQLRWLILTLRAASSKTDRNDLLPSVQDVVDAIASDADRLKNQRQILIQAVTSSVFARAYDIGGVNVDNWPLAPGHIGQVYEQILLPPLRRPDHLEALRSAWIRRIQQEKLIQQNSITRDDSGKRQKGANDHDGQRAYETFVTETMPALQWQMEMDLFKNGDEQGAALRMLNHLEKYMAHKSARTWSDELMGVLSPEQ
jgi:hypothetical protein